MPYFVLSATAPGALYDDVTAWSRQGVGVGLRVDYGSTTGAYPLSPVSYVTMPEWSAEMFKTLWGVMPIVDNLPDIDDLYRAVDQDCGKVDCQISVDGGVTWLSWIGSAWATAGSVWTSFYTLNAHLDSIPFRTYRLLFKVRLSAGTDTVLGPVLRGIRLGYDVLPGMATEDIHRTLIRWLRGNLRVYFRETYTLAAAAASVDTKKTLPVFEVEHAYNLTTDPTRHTDIAAGSFSGTVIALTGVQALGSVIEIEWKGALPSASIILQRRDPDFFQELATHSPCLVLRVTDGEEADKAKASGEMTTINFATQTYWRERMATPVDYRIFVQAVASSAAEGFAIRLCNAARSLFKERSETYWLPTVLLGSYLEIVEFTPAFDDASLEKEGLSIKTFSCIICAREWAESGLVTGPLATTHELINESDF